MSSNFKDVGTFLALMAPGSSHKTTHQSNYLVYLYYAGKAYQSYSGVAQWSLLKIVTVKSSWMPFVIDVNWQGWRGYQNLVINKYHFFIFVL